MTNSGRRMTAAAWLACAACGLAADGKLYEAVEPHMGTLFRIQLYAKGPGQSSAALRAAFGRIAELDAALSDYQPESELNRLCRTGVRHPVAVSPDLFRVLSASLKISEETGGAFDVTLGPVIRLWRQARIDHRLPTPEALREAAARCGYRKLHLDPGTGTVLIDRAAMQLDLGAIAKGYAADAALAVLAQSGIRSALVAASGDLAIGEPPPGRRGWRVGVERGGSDATIERILELSNAAVSTSGDAEQHIEIAGRRYSHIIDPATLMGLTSPITVTVVARRGIDADPLATAVSVLGAERGLALIRARPDTAVRIVVGEGVEKRVVESSNWTELAHEARLP